MKRDAILSKKKKKSDYEATGTYSVFFNYSFKEHMWQAVRACIPASLYTKSGVFCDFPVAAPSCQPRW